MNDEVLLGSSHATLSTASILAESAWRYPEKAALIWSGHEGPDAVVTYGALWRDAKAIAGLLRERGIRRGDRVAMMVPNVPDFPRIYYAILAIGAVAVPVHLLYKKEEIEHVLRDSRARLLISAAPALGESVPAAQAAHVPVISVLLPQGARDLVPAPRLEDLLLDASPIHLHESMSPEEPATVLYTSGTTGLPKGAVGCHLSLVEQVNVCLLDLFDLRVDDVVFGGLPLFHTFGQTCVMNTAFRRGATVVLLPKFEPVAALEAMVEHGVTAFMGVPTMYVGLLQAAAGGAPKPRLRFAISGGAALPVAVLEAFQDTFGAAVHEGYGLTETSPVVSFNRVGEPIHPGTIGRHIWGVDVQIAYADIEDRIEPVPHGELGELVVRGHNVFSGYVGRPEATAEVIVDGWFRTGDLATMDDKDVITIVDRKKDMIIRNGYNVYPIQVEGVIARHPKVLMSAVFGVPHEVHGQEVAAAVVLKPGETASAAEIRDFVKTRIASYKYPRVVEFVEALPLGPSGKVLKRELARIYADAAVAV